MQMSQPFNDERSSGRESAQYSETRIQSRLTSAATVERLNAQQLDTVRFPSDSPFKRFSPLLWIAAVALFVGGCATCPVNPETGRRPAKTPEPYTQVAYPDADTVELQIAVRKFVSARPDQPVIWLTGVSHIGDPGYYETLQRYLDKQQLVLFEGVKGLGEPGKTPSSPAQAASKSEASIAADPSDSTEGPSLQVNLAKALGLVFQLQALHYNRPQFRNSDLSVDQIQKLMVDQQKSPATPTTDKDPPPETEFQSLVETMQGTSLFGAVVYAVVELVGQSPRLQAMTKLAMIQLLGEFKGDLSRAEFLPPEMRQLMEVLIQKRNQAVITDLKSALQEKNPPASISIIYGAGHLADMEMRLRHQLHYCPVDQFWLPVFSVNTEEAGLSQFEIGLVRSVVRAQLEALQPSHPR